MAGAPFWHVHYLNNEYTWEMKHGSTLLQRLLASKCSRRDDKIVRETIQWWYETKIAHCVSTRLGDEPDEPELEL